ncbi:MAG: hypothetical protein JNK85_10770 [Verrucomicrobiales bacterium]|nr:hypothetical protein [Verrucomicrobiales bacterium]
MTPTRQPQFLQRWSAQLLLLGVLCLIVPLVHSADATPKKVELSSFELADQFGTSHRYEFPRQKPLVLLVGDRKGSEDIDGWITPLKQHFSATADIAGIADVRGVPRFLRDRITAAIKKSRPVAVMLDYEGTVTDLLPCERKVANVFVFSPRGTLIEAVSGSVDDGRLATLRRAIEAKPPTGTAEK